MGGFFVLAVIREFAPIFCAIIVAGVAGTAITADLGARKIREELDALQVLGVDPVKNLVVPRFLALMLVTGLFDVFAIFAGLAGGLLANAVQRRRHRAHSSPPSSPTPPRRTCGARCSSARSTARSPRSSAATRA